ncbi:MAG: class I SAM-dependent methyltransferase [Anaerolineae bacterium]
MKRNRRVDGTPRGRPVSSDYHLYRPLVFRTPVGGVRLYTKPGIFSWDHPDQGAFLALRSIKNDGLLRGSRVLDLGCGHGIIGFGCLQLQPGIELHLADASLAAYTAVTISQERLGYSGRAWYSDVASDVPGDLTFDVVVANLPRGKALGEQFIREAWHRLEPGGRFYLAGSKDTGILTRIATMEEWFGNGEMVAVTANYRVARALKRPRSFAPPPGDYHEWQVATMEARGRTWEYVTKPGVFSWRQLDAGTRRLLAHIQVRDGERVLDLGCGAGQVGLVAYNLAEGVELVQVDDSLPAVRAAERTARHNGLERTTILPSDVGSAVIGERFDVVATNPPFHLGAEVEYSVAEQFIEDSRDVLGPKGRLYVVSNTFLPHDKTMESMFRRVEVVHEDSFFKVILGARPVGRVKNRPKPPLIQEP